MPKSGSSAGKPSFSFIQDFSVILGYFELWRRAFMSQADKLYAASFQNILHYLLVLFDFEESTQEFSWIVSRDKYTLTKVQVFCVDTRRICNILGNMQARGFLSKVHTIFEIFVRQETKQDKSQEMRVLEFFCYRNNFKERTLHSLLRFHASKKEYTTQKPCALETLPQFCAKEPIISPVWFFHVKVDVPLNSGNHGQDIQSWRFNLKEAVDFFTTEVLYIESSSDENLWTMMSPACKWCPAGGIFLPLTSLP
jgi:hypothetical protein